LQTALVKLPYKEAPVKGNGVTAIK